MNKPYQEALAADPNVDIIYVATPHPHHVVAAKLALNAGKHILVEKLFTTNAREAAEIVALANAKKLVVLEAMWTRFLPHMRRIREIIAAGTIGEIRSLIADHTQKLPDEPKHRLNDLQLGEGRCRIWESIRFRSRGTFLASLPASEPPLRSKSLERMHT